MKVAVGSTNPAKVEAVREVFREIYGEVEVVPMGVDSGVPDQPVGLEETIKGAINRAKLALEKTGADFGVGVEAGLYSVPETLTGYMDIQFCAIVDKEGRTTFGHGPGFEYPPGVIRRVFEEDVEVGIAMGELVNDRELKRKIGAIGVLTHGRLVRKELNKLAVLMALVPRLNPEWYGLG
ncbi:inosine/xanthosine triphosphatase [Thermococcus sp. Bubb.Bath]|uniref:inosine/xanthosine triphosphatase n=1 Tax=Thermococcus sp. Bubb.Bath TaxID=1638242 RepID=UPI0014399F78|nr:inosine/xanthosine triphosphatase [Thermococcus sp. Bubb.Bath]NJF25627.1 inosine/xanthosine triphosphatase [Thermococcus sp. Bubb.Bath]